MHCNILLKYGFTGQFMYQQSVSKAKIRVNQQHFKTLTLEAMATYTTTCISITVAFVQCNY